MKIIHRIALGKEHDKNNKLKNMLKEKNIRYEEKSLFLFFYYSEDNPNLKLLQEIVKKYDCLDTVDTEFDKNDILNAEWLRVRSKWYWEYPQPEEDDSGNFGNVTFRVGESLYADNDGIIVSKEPI